MNYIDLHVHSSVSDGSLTPEEVVAEAVKAGLAAFALTDHDTTGGIDDALQAAEASAGRDKPVEVIPGVEISAAYQEKDIHILGLFINHHDPELEAALAGARTERDTRNLKMAENLRAAGINITFDALKAADPEAVITRAHFSKYLISHHYAHDNKEAFQKYLNADTPYYVARHYMDPLTAITLIRQANGVPVLAHPMLYHLGEEALDQLVSNLKKAGLAGIETFYSSNVGYDESNARKLAERYSLIMTGGSDFHGQAKPNIRIGTGRGNLRIPYSILEQLRERI